MPKPAVLDLSVYQGDRYELFLRVRSQTFNPVTELWVPGDYVDLTGWTPSGMIRTNRSTNGNPTATFTCMLSDQASVPGGILCVLLPSESVKLTGNSYVYDIQAKLDADNVTTYITGSITPTQEVTNV